jgi:hypothetical protein
MDTSYKDRHTYDSADYVRTYDYSEGYDGSQDDTAQAEYKRQKVTDPNVVNGRYVYIRAMHPTFIDTRAIMIGNLNKNLDVVSFKRILNEEALKEDSSIIRAWMNKHRTHCYVLTSAARAARKIRERLDDTDVATFKPRPDDDLINHIPTIFVNYVPVRALDTWIEQERASPEDAIWKVGYARVPSKQQLGTMFTRAVHVMLNYQNEDVGFVSKKDTRILDDIQDNSVLTPEKDYVYTSEGSDAFSISFLNPRGNSKIGLPSRGQMSSDASTRSDSCQSGSNRLRDDSEREASDSQRNVDERFYFPVKETRPTYQLSSNEQMKETDAYLSYNRGRPNYDQYPLEDYYYEEHPYNYSECEGGGYAERYETLNNHSTRKGRHSEGTRRTDNIIQHKPPISEDYPRPLNTEGISIEEYDEIAREKYANGRVDLYIPVYEGDQ